MTSKEAFKHTCKPGAWLANIASLGDTPNWQEQPEPMQNHESTYLLTGEVREIFGYDAKEFMARQYK